MMKRSSQAGFTLVELMIATTVFSVIMLVLTASIIQISKVYYKGITAAQTQSAVRAVVDDVSQAIQMSGGTIRQGLAGGGYAGGYCIGSRLYMYKAVNQDWNGVTGSKAAQLTTTSGPVLMGETVDNGCSTVTTLPPAGPVSNAGEQLRQKMRLVKFIVRQSGANLYTVTIRIVAGDDDMLCSPGFAGNKCNSGTVATNAELSQPDLQCKGIRDMQYCAVSEITTTIERRVN